MSRAAGYLALINTRRWRRVRGLVLSRTPLCERCRREGRVRSATEVHHIIPLESIRDERERERAAYDPFNLRALCHECHVAEHREMHKGSREERSRRQRAEFQQFAARWMGIPGGDF